MALRTTTHSNAPQNNRVPVITMTNLGTSKKVDKGEITFFPLVDFTNFDSPMVNETPLMNAFYTFFEYRMWFTATDASGKETFSTKQTRWVDTELRLPNDPYQDPGCALGLDLKNEERTADPKNGVFSFEGTGNFNALSNVIRVPILLLATSDFNTKRGIITGKGELALLELKISQWQKITELYKGMSDADEMSYRTETDKMSYDWHGFSNALTLSKDSSKRPNSYSYARTNDTIHPDYFFSLLPKAEVALKDYIAYIEKTNIPYAHLLQTIAPDNSNYNDVAKEVYASVAKMLLTTWAEPFENSTDGIIEAFDSLVAKYTVSKAARDYTTGQGRQRVGIKIDKNGITKTNGDDSANDTTEEESPF